MRPSTPTPTTSPDWSRFAACHICGVGQRQACVNLERAGQPGGGPRVRNHNERPLRVDRDGRGVMVLGRREHLTQSRPGTTHGAHAHHASVDGVAVCSGALLAEDTFHPLSRLSSRERCQRPACRRLWANEEVMA